MSHASRAPMVNALTVDVEDYFQVSAFEHMVKRENWDSYESRVCRNTDRLLALFDRHDVRGTFFVLGWVAERFPDLVRRIARNGHEVASHGYWHRLVYDQTPEQFREDVRRSRDLLAEASGQPILGYRAPSFSITERSLWALDVLAEEGYVYDASVFPIHHDRYGIPSAPRQFHQRQTSSGAMWECPASTVRFAGTNFPVGGGGYLRLFPFSYTRWGISRINEADRLPVVCYLHPWEIDPDQPRLAVGGLSALRHYGNLAKTEHRLVQLLNHVRFAPLADLLGIGQSDHVRMAGSPTPESATANPQPV